jgi:hypothetical protein
LTFEARDLSSRSRDPARFAQQIGSDRETSGSPIAGPKPARAHIAP